MNPQATWSLSFILGMLLAGVLVLLCVVVCVIALRHIRSEFGLYWLVGGLVATFIVLGATACMTFPWDGPYHRFEPKVGEVAAVDKRLVRSGEGMQEKIVVAFVDTPGQWGCEDTRCSLVRPGDMLALRCIKRWDYSATDGYDCRFVAHERAAS